MRIFPNDAGLVRIASALAIERKEKWMERRCFTMPGAPQTEAELRQGA